MDVLCERCGEPWDLDHVQHEMTPEERERFWDAGGCPACHGREARPRNPEAQQIQAALVWLHALAIGYSLAYLSENRDGIRGDWPRIPLPGTRGTLEASALLGRRVADLLDTEHPVQGVTAGAVRDELRVIGPVARVGGGQLGPQDTALTAGWGHSGQGNAVMPSKGKVVLRDYTPEERAAIETGASALGIAPEQVLAQLGDQTCDVYLNDVAYWSNIPQKVWEYVIGGYQVIKKWLSYREEPVLGRALTSEEVRYVTEMARRIAAIVLLQPGLDENYRKCKANTYTWPIAPMADVAKTDFTGGSG